MRRAEILVGDVLDVLPGLSGFDAVLCDPPYGLEFMGKEWDAPWKASGDVLEEAASVGGFQDGAGGNPYSRSRVRFGRAPGFQAWATEWAALLLPALKPGAPLMAFGGTRTYHRLAVAIEDAGFEIRDTLCWLYGSGFPKSHDISKGIDKAAGAEREVVGYSQGRSAAIHGGGQSIGAPDPITAPATPEAARWSGYGTALKPSHEPVTLAYKPYAAADELAIMVPRIGELLCEVDSFAQTGTPLSDSLRTSGLLNIASSLRQNSDALSRHASTFTTRQTR